MTSIDSRARIGHVHLTVSDLERSLAFYRDVLGFEVTTRYGRGAVLLSGSMKRAVGSQPSAIQRGTPAES